VSVFKGVHELIAALFGFAQLLLDQKLIKKNLPFKSPSLAFI